MIYNDHVSFRNITFVISVIVIAGLISGYLFSQGNQNVKVSKLKSKTLSFPSFPIVNNCHGPKSPIQGILSIPSLDLVAPVEQGDSQEVMAQAIGHNPATVWPGQEGTAELSAHDVAQFSFISLLNNGDKIYYWIPCQVRFEFSVVKKEVVTAGSVVWGLDHPAVVLETCWPSNVLYFTNKRLLVFAQEVKVASVDSYPKFEPSEQFSVNINPALESLGLSLDSNYAPMGYMYFNPPNDYSWIESPNPLDAESLGLNLYFGALDAIKYNNPTWWSNVAPSVAYPASLAGHSVESYLSKVDFIMNLSNQSLLNEVIETKVNFSIGTYDLKVTISNNNGNLVISGFSY